MQQIVPGLWTFSGLLVGRVYLIQDPDGLTVVDSGIALAADRIVAQLRAAGWRPREVRRILITHAHPDHVGGLPRLHALTGAQVWASAVERPVIEGRVPITGPPRESLSPLLRRVLPPPMTVAPTPVDREIGDGEVLAEVMGGLQVVATPGHAPGHLAFWQPRRRVLFCGDVMMRLSPNLRLPVAAFTTDMAENKRSIGRLAALNVAVLCLGHGVPLRRHAAATIRAFADRVGA